MRFLLLFLFPFLTQAAIVDYGPPQDILGHWEFDLYDIAGLQRGTATNPIYTSIPGDVAVPGGNITTVDIGSVSNTRFAGQSNVSGTPTPLSSVTYALNSAQTVMVIVSGTWTGTLTVEVSSDGGTNFEARSIHVVGTAVFSSAITSNVTGSMNATAKTHVRLRATSAITGTATVKFLASDNLSNIYVANAIKLVDGTTTVSPPQLTIKPANTSPTVGDTAAVVTVSPNQPATYAAVAASLPLATSPTDIFTISGSATKVIRVTGIVLTGSQSTSNQRDVYIYKRSSLDAGGTSGTVPPVPSDSADPAATATVRYYTANPTTLGTAVGIVTARKVMVASPTNNSDEFVVTYGDANTKPLVLRGVNENISINMAGVTSNNSSFNVKFIWTEDNL